MAGAVPYSGTTGAVPVPVTGGGGADGVSLEQEVRTKSIGELIGEISKDLGQLVHQEIELAKAEMKQEVTKVGKGAGMLGGAGFAGYMVALFISLTVAYAIGTFAPAWVGALVVTVLWSVIGAGLYLRGREALNSVKGPVQTKETLKEDAQWVRHPTS